MRTFLAAAALLAGALTGAAAGRADSELLNVSYDPTREFYKAFNAAFAAHWKAETGE
ncbi:MAG TPA: sulfate transporter subunit, partial [Alphaproteobacteria bacterium]|nr:sulfate transporter subunit [Alphaproteobacteria bacterium]